MSDQTLRVVIFLVMLLHGVGHIMGVVAALEVFAVKGWSSRSWLLSGPLSANANRVICGVLFLIGFIGFGVTALALMDWGVPHADWRSMAVVMAVVSLTMIIIYWDAFVALIPNKIGALAVNGAILIAYFVLDWPTEADIGF